ncbi:CRISPR-associated endonuclease Cas2 [Serratia proteamaculans]|uniref:CRISPR-associated endonuclease Cas2 n=1 Tax=Serratia proteamaculans TaxID=28151 RepID=UPI001F47AA8C|nr:CRISPR-associated endonuclease Cas2 [Serratia proteamaculans]
MARYIVTYDLVNRRDYTLLIEKIKSYRQWAHPLESVWIIITDDTSSQLRDSLSDFIDKDDKLLIMKTTQGASWIGLNNNVSDWIKNNSASK